MAGEEEELGIEAVVITELDDGQGDTPEGDV